MSGELAKALAAARAELSGKVYAAGWNAHNRYAYVGHRDVLASGVREALSNHGLAVVQTSVEYVGELPGGKNVVLLWRGTYRVLHSSGEHIDMTIQGTCQHNDKAAYQVNTMLDRTIYLRLLALAGSSEEETDDDRDHRALKKEAQENGPPPADAPNPTDKEVADLVTRLSQAQTNAEVDKIRADGEAIRARMTKAHKLAMAEAKDAALNRIANAQHQAQNGGAA